MPADQTDLELDQVVTFLKARGWIIDAANRFSRGLQILARRAPVETPYHAGPLRDLIEPPAPLK